MFVEGRFCGNCENLEKCREKDSYCVCGKNCQKCENKEHCKVD